MGSWQNYKYKGKELQTSGMYDYGARFYMPDIGIFGQHDPLSEKTGTPYAYTYNNPIRFIDPTGMEPILPNVGTSSMFRYLLDNSPRKVGLFVGNKASDYLRSLGNTEFSWSQMRPLPTETGYFNNKEGRYIYTEKGGWIDMSHFMFYAGKAYEYKMQKQKAQEMLNKKEFGYMREGVQLAIIKKAIMNPVGEAIQDGYFQEKSDSFVAKYSAYSYEDLPSDKYGADFGANYFDPKSKLSFGQQLENYLNNELKAINPENAPNYKKLPITYPKDKPTRINKTTIPVYTRENP